MIDYFTRWVEAEATPTNTTEDVIRVFMRCVVCRHGVPQVLISDRGSNYISSLASQVFTRLGLKKHTSTAYHPQSNGAVERFNRTLKDTLRVWANESANNWDEMLPYAVFSYNSAYHSTIKQTPFYLLYCRQPRLPLDVSLGRVSEFYESYDSYVYEMNTRIYNTHRDVQRVYESLTRDQTQAAEQANSKLPKYESDQLVFLRDSSEKNKLFPKWLGPFRITRKISDVTYELEIKGKLDTVHINRLKAYHSPEVSTHASLDEQIGHYRLMLSSAQQQVEASLSTQESIRTRLAELEAEHSSTQIAASSSSPSSSSPPTTMDDPLTTNDTLTQPQDTFLHSNSDEPSLPDSPASSAPDRAVTAHHRTPTAHARAPRPRDVSLPSAAPTYQGLLRSRPLVAYQAYF
jgi:hypothetical protein